MSNIKIGDSVAVIDDAIVGKVTAITNGSIAIETEDGFIFQFSPHDVLKVNTTDNLDLGRLSHADVIAIQQQKAEARPKKQVPVKSKARNKAQFVVDLHIHQLTDSTRGMTNFDMLNLQLDTAKRQLDFAIKKRIPKLVFIHGVGEGVLRQELYTLLRRYDNVTFYDADYKLYGLGATEVRVFQNMTF